MKSVCRLFAAVSFLMLMGFGCANGGAVTAKNPLVPAAQAEGQYQAVKTVPPKLSDQEIQQKLDSIFPEPQQK